MTMKAPDEGTASAATTTQMTVETTLELYDFGVEVKVAPPPASQVEVVRPDAPPTR